MSSMNDVKFNEELAKVSHDLRLIYDGQIGKWGVYQTRSRHFVLAGNTDVRPWLLWNIEDEDGEFRLPDRRDLIRAQQTVIKAHYTWDKPVGWLADQVEAKEAQAKEAKNKRLDERIYQAARDIRHTSTVVKTHWRS